MHIHIHYNYSIEVIRNNNKKTTLEEYYKIKIYLECVFLFLHNSKTKYTSQTFTINDIIYKIYKSTTSNFNIKIVIAVITQYKMQPPPFLVVANSYELRLDETTMLELGKCC